MGGPRAGGMASAWERTAARTVAARARAVRAHLVGERRDGVVDFGFVRGGPADTLRSSAQLTQPDLADRARHITRSESEPPASQQNRRP